MYTDIDHDALVKKWSVIANKPFELFQTVLDRKVDAYHRDDILHNILTFIKLFPTHRYKFERSVNAFIIFSEVMEINTFYPIRLESNVSIISRTQKSIRNV